jgi:hypothetical protein
MESVVRVITMTGTRTKKYKTSSNADSAAQIAAGGGLLGPGAALPETTDTLQIRRWRSMRGRNNKGRFIPDMDPEPTPEELAAKAEAEQAAAAAAGSDESDEKHQPAGDETAADSDEAVKAARDETKSVSVVPSTSAKHSSAAIPTSSSQPGLLKQVAGAVGSLLRSKPPPKGPHVPKKYDGPVTIDGFAVSGPADALIEESDQVLDTEINIQLGDFTLKSSRLEVLNEFLPLDQSEDYMAIFGRDVDATPMQCAEVRHASHRQWYRLVGRRHDVMYWDPDRREVETYANYTRAYDSSSEQWIVKALEPIKEKMLKGVKLLLPAEWYPSAAPYAVLQGVATRSVEEKAPSTGNASADRQAGPLVRDYKTLHEIVVFQKQRVVHIYTIVEHGRRWYRSLKFASDARFSLCNMPVHIPRVLKTKKWGQQWNSNIMWIKQQM